MNPGRPSSRPPADPYRWTTNRLILATLSVMGIALGFALVYRLRIVVFLVLVAVVLGTAIRPAVNRLQARGVLRPVGVFAVYLLIVLTVFGITVIVVPLVVEQGSQLLRNIPDYYENLRTAMLDSPSRILTNLALRIPASPALFPTDEPTAAETITQLSRTYTIGALGLRGVLGTIAVLLIGFYWALEGDRVVRSLMGLLPLHRRAAARRFLDDAEHKLGGFIRGQGILSLTVGAAAFLAYSLIGLPFAFVLAIIAMIFELVPFFGPVLGAVPAVLVSLTYDPATTVWVLAASGLIQLLENAVLVPRIMNHSMGVNPIVILLSLVTFTSVLGFYGAVLAFPIAALLQQVLDRITSSVERAGVYAGGLPPAEREEMEAIALELELLLRDVEPGGAAG